MPRLLAATLILFLAGCPADPTLPPNDEPAPNGEPSPNAEPTPNGEPAPNSEPAASAQPQAAPARPFREVMAEKLGMDSLFLENAVALFDGETLFGWRTDDAPDGVWSVEDHAIVGRGEKADILFTAMPWINGQLTLEVRLAPGGNSGVFVRSALDPKDLTADTFELNLASQHPEGYTTGSVVGRKKVDAPWPAVDDGQWHKLFITLGDDSVFWQLQNGDEVRVDLTPEDRRHGYIGLQHRTGDVAFRRILFRPEMDRTLRGNLDGWHVVNQQLKDGTLADVSFQTTDAGFRATGGPGFLESDDTYGNFIFETYFTTHAPEVNSGLFYRNIKGTPEAPSNGYEVQIHNGFEGEDRTPTNAGTGAIFRRQDARLVAAEDNADATLTVNVYDDRVMTWVNGYPVLDWTDAREPDPDGNPRRGQRLAPGHLTFQAHDPGTDISFRHIAVEEFPK